MRVGEVAAADAAATLGRLLDEPVWEHPGAWLDGLTLRLAQSRDAAAMRAALESRQADEARRRERAAADLRGPAGALGALVAQAGVSAAEELPQAEALLVEALRRHREKAQAPVVALAGDYFRLMTGGRFARLRIDDERAAQMFRALEKFVVAGQVLVFTPHHHHLLDIASAAVSEGALRLHRLEGGIAGRAPQTKKI